MNPGIDPKWAFYLGILITIETGIGQGILPLTDMFPADWIHFIKGWSQALAFCGTAVMTGLTGYSSKASGPLTMAPPKLLVLLAILLTGLLMLGGQARAADNLAPVKAINSALTAGYPTKCGLYYGIGTGGNAGAVNGGAVGEQIVQGDLDAIVGYTCPFATSGFWFVEAQGGFSNLNGSSNGLSLSGPAVFIERFGAGSPINSMLGGILPAGLQLNPSMPSLPLLPANTTASPGNAYLFGGLVEQDIGAQIGLLSGHQWVVAPLLGAGIITRVSNGTAIDTWAGWQMNSNSFCPGGGSSCARLGNMARVGVSVKY